MTAPTVRLLVVLEEEIRDDDAGPLMGALAALAGVESVVAVIESFPVAETSGYQAEDNRWANGVRALVPPWLTETIGREITDD